MTAINVTTYEVASVYCGGPGITFPGVGPRVQWIDNKDNAISPCEGYKKLLDASTAEIIIYIHDDVTIHDPEWLERVLAPFHDPQCVAVGLGGATGLGHPDLYKKSYNIWNMARSGYTSNQTDAEVHGARFTGSRKVAVLDAFFLAVRADFVRSVGGWPVSHLTHHCLDLWLSCEAARAGKETWLVGVKCTHHGGGTSTKPAYAEAKWLKGGSMQTDHTEPHRWLYDNYKDVLPIRV